jgi:sortase (surface protein transpeptidase)
MAEQPLYNIGNPAIKNPGYQSRPSQYYRRPNAGAFLDLTSQSIADNQTIYQPKPQVSQPTYNLSLQKQASNSGLTPVGQPRLVPDKVIEETEQQFTAPVYLNNYNGEYEDTRYRRFSLRALRITKRLVFSTGIAAVVVLVGAAFVLANWSHYNIAHAQSSRPTNTSQTGIFSDINQFSSGPFASSTEPTTTQISNYNVSASQPKYLIVPKLNILSMITPVNLAGSNYIGTPNNIFNVGWWQSSSSPGQTGSVVLDGFTSNGTGVGVFSTLSKLKTGDTFQIEKGDNTKLTYQIERISNFGSNNISMEQAISPINPNKPSLNIITCSGETTACPSSPNDFVIFAQQQ